MQTETAPVRRVFLLIIQIAAFCTFAGRAWQHLFQDAPFRTFLWSEKEMSGIVETFFGMNWSEYVRSPETDIWVENIIVGHGWFYVLCAVAVLVIHKVPKISGVLMWLGAAALAVLAFLYYKEKFYNFGQFLEYSLQIMSPILLWFLVKNPEQPQERFIKFVKVLIGITFICHGLYALGYYPRPGHFVQMTISILGVEESGAVQFLNFAGIMDIALAVGIFLPRKVAIPFLIYACIWGFGTSIARVWSEFYLEFWQETLTQNAWKTVVRASHFLVPAAVLFWELKVKPDLT